MLLEDRKKKRNAFQIEDTEFERQQEKEINEKIRRLGLSLNVKNKLPKASSNKFHKLQKIKSMLSHISFDKKG